MNINLTLIGQVGTFLVFWWFVNKYIWPVFAKVATERQRKIESGLTMADNARHSVAAAEIQCQEMLDEAKTQANTIVTQADKRAKQMIERARGEAQEAGVRELNHARELIAQEERAARARLRSQLSALVVEGTEKVLAREINAKDHDRLLQELTEKF